MQKAADVPIATHIASACGLIPQASPIMIDIGVKIAQREVPIIKFVPTTETSLDKGTQRKTTENELPSLTQCTA